MKFYKDITLKDIDWNLDFKIQENFSRQLMEKHYLDIDSIVPEYLLKKLNDADLRPSKVRIFIWPKNFVGIWHIDGLQYTDDDHPASLQNVSMNWVLSGSGLIQWNSQVKPKLKPMRGVYSGILSQATDLVEEECTGHGVLVDTTVPHRVVTGADGRTSITLQWQKNKNDFDFPVMVEKLKSIGLTI
jgi:hypothetical protein